MYLQVFSSKKIGNGCNVITFILFLPFHIETSQECVLTLTNEKVEKSVSRSDLAERW